MTHTVTRLQSAWRQACTEWFHTHCFICRKRINCDWVTLVSVTFSVKTDSTAQLTHVAITSSAALNVPHWAGNTKLIHAGTPNPQFIDIISAIIRDGFISIGNLICSCAAAKVSFHATFHPSDKEFDLHLQHAFATAKSTVCAKYEPPLGGGKEVTENRGLTRWSLLSMDDLKEKYNNVVHLYDHPGRSK